MYRILLVEDDQSLAELLSGHLHKYDYECKVCSDFNDISGEVEQFDPHLVLLDINLPKYDGFYWCRKIRQFSTCPIIIISARSSEMEQIYGIENGADDYITKPFSLEVVVAKVNGQIRRNYGDYAANPSERTVVCGELKLYLESLILEHQEQQVLLTKKEAMLAGMLLENAPKVLSRETLLSKLWDDESFVEENTLNVNIARLRKKLQDVGADAAIEAVRGVGYRLLEEPI
ncbi:MULTISPECIES: response regulator transcription factor [unclassified Paenibacillus]|uniref:response regulator transcription factor n=1 Tax=unclassified Paenibacillus TaxID=185978 RepID=UPI000838039B|nr:MULTISPECIES: response regulator transcription factor [unclassified Paenibacillus]NWL90299.1 DNA-binding response regulator [Paenibacillus sp. 79R4]